ncbi:unnamed protein product [Pleuronectes platessa]|uniref:Uncharacterized protein n=1 Tax=Pleuronectes platessa TaxID=8262 RepID=A0A9N7VL25_PLEPL|nr:unnamed protein product [Pleuronectes platessa]
MCIDHPPPGDQYGAYGGWNKNSTLLSGNGITLDTSRAYQTAPHIRPLDKRLWAADTISSQNKAPRPVWTLVDTWRPNVAGHATDGSLIRHCDSHLFPIQPQL